MNESINLKKETLVAQINKMKKINKDIETILDSMKKNTNELKDLWSSKTADNVFKEFENEYKIFESIKEQNVENIKFLDSVVNRYESLDEGIKKNSDKLNT